MVRVGNQSIRADCSELPWELVERNVGSRTSLRRVREDDALLGVRECHEKAGGCIGRHLNCLGGYAILSEN